EAIWDGRRRRKIHDDAQRLAASEKNRIAHHHATRCAEGEQVRSRWDLGRLDGGNSEIAFIHELPLLSLVLLILMEDHPSFPGRASDGEGGRRIPAALVLTLLVIECKPSQELIPLRLPLGPLGGE